MILYLWIKFRALRALRTILDGWIACCLAAAGATKHRHRRIAWAWCYLAGLALPARRRIQNGLVVHKHHAAMPHPVPQRLTPNRYQEGRRRP
jgi:hypothetical protein